MGIIKHPEARAAPNRNARKISKAAPERGRKPFTFAEFNEKGALRTAAFPPTIPNGEAPSMPSARISWRCSSSLPFWQFCSLRFLQPYPPGQFDAFNVNNDPVTGVPLRNSQPDSVHWLGTNSIGQDLWSRLWRARARRC